MTYDLAFWIHSGNLALGVTAFVLLAGRVLFRSREMPEEVELLHHLSVVLLFGLLVVSGRQLADLEPLTVDAVVITVVKLCVLALLWKTRNTLYRTGTRHQGGGRGKDEDNPDRQIRSS